MARAYYNNVQWVERPTFRYIGKQRHDRGVLYRPGTHYTAPHSANVIKWTVADQREAVLTHNIFIERCSDAHNKVVITIVDKFRGTQSPAAWLVTISKGAFQGHPFFGKLYDFIQQQDEFGWSGRWDANIDRLHTWMPFIRKPYAKTRAAYIQKTTRAAATRAQHALDADARARLDAYRKSPRYIYHIQDGWPDE